MKSFIGLLTLILIVVSIVFFWRFNRQLGIAMILFYFGLNFNWSIAIDDLRDELLKRFRRESYNGWQ